MVKEDSAEGTNAGRGTGRGGISGFEHSPLQKEARRAAARAQRRLQRLAKRAARRGRRIGSALVERSGTLRNLLSAPFIYSMILPFLIFDISLEIYHRVCFFLYRIPYVRRRDYILIDRHKLPYLSLLEKVNCAYCGYANGLINYARAVAAETEKYWCAIKHHPQPGFHAPFHHKIFAPYGDPAAAAKNPAGRRWQRRKQGKSGEKGS